ncbi:hypothetical protein NPIL_564581 [Nephila pilipes]|uniref:Uncharacterized protein n=1 Tax=Nephila pilipes TaxID=299642 RepID=A0A8X6U6B8_NEPPI|nr:hypothetical protein NPIL_564581 [Nephila pilipes]
MNDSFKFRGVTALRAKKPQRRDLWRKLLEQLVYLERCQERWPGVEPFASRSRPTVPGERLPVPVFLTHKKHAESCCVLLLHVDHPYSFFGHAETC